MADARSQNKWQSCISPLLFTLQPVFCGDRNLHANIYAAITSELKNEWSHPPPSWMSGRPWGSGTLQLDSNPLLSLAFAICNCVTTAGATETVPLRNRYLKGLQKSKKPTNPSPSSGTALIIPTAAATKLFFEKCSHASVPKAPPTKQACQICARS